MKEKGDVGENSILAVSHTSTEAVEKTLSSFLVGIDKASMR